MKDDLVVVDFEVDFFVRVFTCDCCGFVRFVSGIIDDFEFQRVSSLKEKTSNFETDKIRLSRLFILP